MQTERMDFAAGSHDAVWCKAAVLNLGFEPGLRRFMERVGPGGDLG